MKLKESSLFKDLKWQFLGPTNISGRVTDVAVPVPRGKNYTIYAAAASGGVWKTTNEGTTWKPVFEHAASTSIGDVDRGPVRCQYRVGRNGGSQYLSQLDGRRRRL